MTELSVSQWQNILEFADGETYADIVAAIKDADLISVTDPDACVSEALETGPLTEDKTAGMFGSVRLEAGETPDTQTETERGSVGSNPGTDTDKSLQERSLDAFAAAIEFFHNQLDREIPETYTGAPSTPREYYEEVRGWNRETIESKQLGYAPANEYALEQYLRQEGYTEEAIQGTGLFYEDFTPHFQGRYVLPYFNTDGRPVYAISRSLDEQNGGHPNDWTGDQKYTKAIKTKERSYVDEPIYGAETVSQDTSRLLVAGGIADAITLHEAGYSCISPVTTVRFKDAHEARVAALVDEYDLEGVYMLNDAERPTIDKTELEAGETVDSITEVLTIEQYGEGLRGAFGNAEFLLEENISPYLVTLPGGDKNLRKLDPDDYLKENWGSVETILQSATHAEDDPRFNEWRSNRQSRAVEEAIQTGGYAQNTGTNQAGTNQTALYDLEFTDVAPLSVGDRTNNPLGHHGNSEGYFVCVDKRGSTFGFDHKHRVAYNALSFILCDAGERRADNPNGPLTDWEVFAAWNHAKSYNHLPESDPVPYRALIGVAISDGLIEREALVQRDSETGEIIEPGSDNVSGRDSYQALPPGTYNTVLRHIEDTYNVKTGRAHTTAALPLEILDTLNHNEARRFAQKRGVEWPDTREVREQLRNEIFEVMNHSDQKVIDAPTALGKTHTVATEPWVRRGSTTGESPVIHTHETKKARDQAADASENADVEYAVLEGRTEACPVAAGEHDPLGREGTVDDFDREELPETVITIDGTPASEWFEQVCEGRGLPFSVAHKYLDNHNDQNADLPCCAGEGEECPAVTQWDGLPRTETGEPAVDVIHCTHQFAHVPSLRNGTNLIFDERPDFREDLTTQQVREAISAYLSVSGAPVTTFEEFVTRALNGDTKRNEHAQHATLQDAFGYEPNREWYLETDGAHTLAPALTRAVYYALKPDAEGEDEHSAQDANGRYSATVAHEPPRLDANASDESGWNRTYVSVTLNETNTGLKVKTVRNTPSLSGARSVIGLDAHPTQTQWQLNVHPDIETTAVLSPEKRGLWRRFERGLLTVGVGDATRPYTSGEYFDRDGSEAFFAALRDRFGERFRTAITASSVEHDTKEILSDVGVEEPETMHYGEEKSRNDFGGENIGALNGCIDPGDDFVLDLLAEAELEATPETTENENGEEERAHGRGFVGPDADAANEILASVREQHTAQSAGRYARNADEPEDRAIVFVRTDAAPPGFLDMQVPGVEWLATDCQQEIIDTLTQRECATTRELAETVGCSKEHARQTLGRLKDRGIVNVRENAGNHGAHLYRILAGVGTNAEAHVNLTPETDTTNDDVCSSYTWSLAVSSVELSGSVMNTDTTMDTPADQSQSPAGLANTPPPGD